MTKCFKIMFHNLSFKKMTQIQLHKSLNRFDTSTQHLYENIICVSLTNNRQEHGRLILSHSERHRPISHKHKWHKDAQETDHIG